MIKLNKKLIACNPHPIKFEIYSFIGLVKTYYDLPSNVTDRIVDIFSNLDYPKYFGGIRYENVVLAATIFAMREFQQHFISSSPPFDITDYVICIYGVDKAEWHIKQIYYVLLKIQFIFGLTEDPIDMTLVLPISN